MADVQNIDLSKIIKRLEMIKSLISLEEEDEIGTHISKLEQLVSRAEIENIIAWLKEKSYSKAVTAIEVFINQHNSLSIYLDPEIDALKLEIKSLEGAINFLSDEKADLEKLIHEFGIRHNKELGELLIKLLQYRKENTKGTPQQQEAEDDYNNYHQEYEATKNEKVATLTDEEQKELKNKYRKASKLCHPDVVSEEQKELATKLFAELSAAYEKNDIKRVREILESLENGHFFISKSDAINEKKQLQTEVQKQRLKVQQLKEQLKAIKESDTYKTISSIDNWDNYFADAKQKLRLQLDELLNGK
jgi:DnaJ domain